MGSPQDETTPPFWKNPCSSYSDQSADANEPFYPDISTKELINAITFTTQVAIDHYLTFIEKYVTETFNVPLAQHIKEFGAQQSYRWLPSVPKKLNQAIPKEFKSKLELKNALLDSYEYLQRVAVGMEAVANDFKGTQFEVNFEKCLIELRTVLCEVNSVITNFKIKMRDDIERSIMPDNIRHLKWGTDRHIRDWMIFRDYMNVMEFVLEVFTHLSEQTQPESISS